MDIVVVGGANGIGKETAEKLLGRGHNVNVIDKDRDGLGELPREIDTTCIDITDREAVNDFFRELELDVLVNCAGIQKQGAVEDAPIEEFEEHIYSNFIGHVNTVKAALPGLRRREGKIVNVSSIAGKVAPPFLSGYSASKFAVEGFTDSLRRELEEVDVMLVEPGRVKTGFNRRGRDNLENFVPGSRFSDRYRERLGSEQKGVSPEKAAAKLAGIVESGSKPRYTVTREAWILRKLDSIIPDRIQDMIFRRL